LAVVPSQFSIYLIVKQIENGEGTTAKENDQ